MKRHALALVASASFAVMVVGIALIDARAALIVGGGLALSATVGYAYARGEA